MIFVGCRMIRHKGVHEFVQCGRTIATKVERLKCQLLGFFDDNPAAISRRQLDKWTRKGLR